MESHAPLPYLREVLLFLALAGLLIPLLTRLRVNQVLAFLALGALLGPYGLGTLAGTVPWLGYVSFPREQGVLALAEAGVLFLMFRIGLELSFTRLWSLRRWVFGAGSVQVLASGALLGTLASIFGLARDAALVVGLVLALSSTAIVVQLLVEQRRLASPLGQASFSILLLQDLAVVPLLVLVTVLAAPGAEMLGVALGNAVLKAALAIGGIYVAGRLVLRPMFGALASPRHPEVFTALTLLTALGTAALTWAAGLSMALGAFLAGLLLSETEFRHEVEVTIEPFKGLLLGLFFMTVGMGVDLGGLATKALVLAPLLRGFGLGWGRALEGALLLGQAGEFAFIVIGSAMQLGLLPRETGGFLLLVVGVSMFLTPALARLGAILGQRLERSGGASALPEPELPVTEQPHVIVAGCGRVGLLLGELLERAGVPFVALDRDAGRVAALRARGIPVYYGDASRHELLNTLRADRAVALVLTMDEPAAALNAVRGIRQQYGELPVFARARDERHASELRQAGATTVVPETLESSLQLASVVLQQLGMPDGAVLDTIEREREQRISTLR